MQIHGMSNVLTGAALYSKPNIAGAAAGEAKTEQSLPMDKVTLSEAAKTMTLNNTPDTNPAANTSSVSASGALSVESSINSGNYTIIGTELSGHIVMVLID